MAIDDDDFDDDLDDLPANTLQQLEADAIRSTQNQRPRPPAVQRPFKPPSRIAPLKPPQSRSGPRVLPPQDTADPQYSDYGFEDEDVIDLDATSHLKPQAQGVQTRWGHTTSIDQFRQSQSQRSYTYEVASKISQTRPGYVTANSLAAPRVAPQHEGGTQARSRDLYPPRVVRDHTPAALRGQSPPLSQMKPRGVDNHSESEESRTQSFAVLEPPKKETSDIPEINVSDLRARLEELERHNRSLQASLSEAQTSLQAKAGEAAILRSKNEKSKSEYEQRLQAIQEKNAELLAKQKGELEAVRKERERAETNNRFLENDLVLEAERARQVKRTLRDATGNGRKLQSGTSPVGTPRKQKNSVTHGDGFDDDVVMLSPSKYQERKKGGTPKQGLKRKRLGAEKALDSPELALQLEAAPSPLQSEIQQAHKAEIDANLIERFERHKETFEFLQRLLNHRPYRSKDRTLEILVSYSFPSSPGKSLSSIVYDQIGLLPKKQEPETFAQGICTLFVHLWEQCLNERYHDPLFLIVDMIQYILDVSPLSLSIATTTAILPQAIATVDLVAVPIAEATIAATKRVPSGRHRNAALNSAANNNASASSVISKLDTKVPTDETLALIHSLALAAKLSDQTAAVESFWKNMQPDFLLVMLNKGQPLRHIVLALRLLRTSVLETSFGSISSKEDQSGQYQSRTELGLLERLIMLLFEIPIPLNPEAEQISSSQYSADDIALLRVEVLRVFLFISATSHGTSTMASHSMFLGRLVKFLSASIAELYSRPPTLLALMHFSHPVDKSRASTHRSSPSRHPVPAINLSMRLLAHILLSAPEIRLNNKLAVIPGGAHKYMVSLTRLAFAETSFVVEHGIEEEVIEVAHRLLEEWVSPEEGEQLVRAHSSARTGREDSTADGGQ